MSEFPASTPKIARIRNAGPLLAAPSWLSEHRIAPPERFSGCLDRPVLVERCLPTKRRLTLLWAPGGFGKTTVLAQCCRSLAEWGVPTAWLALDEDAPSVLDTYLPFAFERAGLDVLEPLRREGTRPRSRFDRTMLLIRALETQAGPWVLALDELERLKNPESVELLNLLVHRAPPNLHLAIACRELPVGFDIASPVLEGSAELFSADDLRFSRREIDRFFDGALSDSELTTVTSTSAGWPIALQVRRSARLRPTGESPRILRDVARNWVEARLWYALADEDREFLLDVGLLDCFDAELLDEVLAGRNLMDRLNAMSSVAGLIEPLRGGTPPVWRLHTLIRDHCANRRRLESPHRYRKVHRRIATALARRGEIVAAMRHAAEAADARLVGKILLDAGGLRYWTREGPERLIAADRYLTDESITRYPRLRLVQMMAYIMKGRLREARRGLDAAAKLVAGSIENPQLKTEWNLLRGMLLQRGCESVGSTLAREVYEEWKRLQEQPGIDPVVRGALQSGLCMVHNIKGEFSAAQIWGDRARECLGERSRYVTMALDIQLGQVAMAQGRVAAAQGLYQGSLQTARRNFLKDPELVALGEILMRELNFERNGITDADECDRIVRDFWQPSIQFSAFAAASTVAVEMAMQMRGLEHSLTILDETCENAHRLELPAYERFLAGQRVAVFAAAGWIGQAERWWRADGLPGSMAGCLDLGRQTWREMEVLSMARLRLFMARGEFGDGRRLARDLLAVAAERGLRRTSMRALALCVALEEAAGNREAALQHLAAFLQLFAETDYGWALVRERNAVVPVLAELVDASPDASIRTSAQSLLKVLDDE